MKSALLLLVTSLASVAAISRETNVSLQESFAIVKNISKIVLQPQETFRIPLEELVRGQRLDFQQKLTYQNGTGVSYEQDDEDDGQIISISKPLKMTQNNELFTERTDQQSLPQTSLVYVDEYFNRYLILIDYKMRLQVHNITSYYLDQKNQAPWWDFMAEPLIWDLFVSDQPLHENRECNNLAQLDQLTLIALCKSNLRTKPGISISIALVIDISQISIRNVKVNYTISPVSYETMRDGKIIVMSKDPFGNYLLWLKENTTNCNFKLYNFTQQGNLFQSKAIIHDFKDPFTYRTQNEENQPALKNQRRDFQLGLGKPSLSQGDFLFCVPQPVDFTTSHIKYLQIKDIKTCTYYDDFVMASDYNYGLLFWKAECDYQGEMSQEKTCKVTPIFRLRQPNVGSISELPLGPDQTEKVVFLQVIYPPKILEIDVSQMNKPPFVSRQYKLGGDMDGQYYSMDLIDGNKDFILTQLVHIQTARPLIRIYHRKSELYQSVHSEIFLGEFIDSGLFIRFINPSQSIFIVKDSHSYKIYKIQDCYLQFNIWNLTTAKVLNQVKNDPEGRVSLNFEVKVRNQTRHSITMQIEIILTDENYVKTEALVPDNQKDDRESIKIKYVCGENVMESSGVIDEYFSGKKNRLILKEQGEEDFFTMDNVRVTYQYLQQFQKLYCSLNELVRFQDKNGGQRGSHYMACAISHSSIVYFPQILSRDEGTFDNLLFFKLPDTRIVEMLYDYTKNNFFILSGKPNANKQAGSRDTVIHIFKIYNIFNWVYSININQEIPMVADFNLREYDSMVFQSAVQQGVLISEPETPFLSLITKQTLLVFELSKSSMRNKPFKVRGLIDLSLVQGLIQSNGVTLRNVKLDYEGYIWVLISNGTMVVYQQVPLNKKKTTTLEDGQKADEREQQYSMLDLQLIKQFQRIDIASKVAKRAQGHINTNVINFAIVQDKIVVFAGKNQTQVHDIDPSNKDVQKSMILPIYMNSEDQFDMEVELGFVVSGKTQKVTYSILENYLLVLYQVLGNGNINEGYIFYLYDITTSRHNSFILRQNVTVTDSRIIDNPIEIDENHVRVQMYRVDEEQIGIILTVDNMTRAYYEFHPLSQLKINPINFEKLKQKCKTTDNFNVNISVYPSDNQKQTVNFTINVQNKGLVISQQQPEADLTVQVEDYQEETSIVKDKRKHVKYSLLSNFQGQRMVFANQSCKAIDNELQTQELCDDITIEQAAEEKSFNIEFLSSKNPAIGFFVIEPFLLFFDQNYTRVYFLDIQQDTKIEVETLFPYLVLSSNRSNNIKPKIEKYFMLEVTYDDDDPLTLGKYIVTANTLTEISISRVIAVKNDKDMEKTRIYRESGQFHIFNSTGVDDNHLLIQYGYNFTLVYSTFTLIDAYAINPKERDNIAAFIVFDDPTRADSSSRIELYHFDLRDKRASSRNISIERNLTFKSIYAVRQGLNLFKVSAIKVIPQSGILVIGLRDVGIMLYNIDQQKIIKIEELKMRLKLDRLIIQAIDVATDIHYKLLTMDSGVIRLTYQEPKDNLQNPYSIQAEIVETQGQREFHRPDATERLLSTISKYGIAYLVWQESDQLIHLRYFSTGVPNQTKALGSYPLGYPGQKCNYLQNIQYIPWVQQFMPNVTDDSMVVALLCDSLLRFIAYNFHPSLKIAIQDEYLMEVSKSQLTLVSTNQISEETYNLNITLLSDHSKISRWYLFAIVVVLALIMLSFQVRVKRQCLKDKEDQSFSSKNSAKASSSSFSSKRVNVFIRDDTSATTSAQDSYSAQNSLPQFSQSNDSISVIDSSKSIDSRKRQKSYTLEQQIALREKFIQNSQLASQTVN